MSRRWFSKSSDARTSTPGQCKRRRHARQEGHVSLESWRETSIACALDHVDENAPLKVDKTCDIHRRVLAFALKSADSSIPSKFTASTEPVSSPSCVPSLRTAVDEETLRQRTSQATGHASWPTTVRVHPRPLRETVLLARWCDPRSPRWVAFPCGWHPG